MPKWTRVSFVAVILVSFVMGMSGTAAGQQAQAGGDKVTNQAAIQRSLAVQAELARIEANKEAFIDELFSRWAPYLDPMVYDLWGSLKPVAMAATPWRLLGASLTTDFESGLRVLRGVVGPGWYIGAYIEGREPVLGSGAGPAEAGAAGAGAAVIGGPVDSLVFTPIAPCRIVDTRGTGVRTGIMAANEARVFDLSADGLIEGQGGDTSCSRLPAYNHRAWAVNITVTGYSAIGHLTVWPYGYPKPATSFMNFSPAVYAMANAGTVTGCNGCLDSITVSVAATTHVIIDVMGYYEAASGYVSGATATMYTTPKAILGSSVGWQQGGFCPVGTVLIGGGSYNDGTDSNLMTEQHYHAFDTPPDFLGTWREYFRNLGPTTINVWVYSRCMDVR
jgi:hypothetical protein